MESQIPNRNPSPFETLIVSTTDSPELSHLRWALRRSSVVALDAEWKPTRTRRTEAGSAPAPEPAPALSFPTVTLLQIACRVEREESDKERGGSPVFLVDLMAVPLESIWEILSEMFVSPSVLKLGFRFKQDLVYLSSTFAAQGGFDRVRAVHGTMKNNHQRRRKRKNKQGVAARDFDEKEWTDTQGIGLICKKGFRIGTFV